jgi:YHS domain-containing protein
MRKGMVTIVALFAFAPWVRGAEEAGHEHAKNGKAAKASESPRLVQKTCPVSGKPISRDHFVEYEGRKVYFCCGNCPAEFQESPTKYLPALYRQIYPQSVQVKCPVMGDPIDGKTFVEYKGERIGFCCDMCPPKFKADPARYMAKFKEACTDQVHCPVTGKAINPEYRAQYKGKTVHFASEKALKAFKANPAKYADSLLPQAGVVARGATADDDLVLCPVCAEGGGGPHKRKETRPTVYEGKVYFLCGEGCVKEFQANPEKYIKAVDAAMKRYASVIPLTRWSVIPGCASPLVFGIAVPEAGTQNLHSPPPEEKDRPEHLSADYA